MSKYHLNTNKILFKTDLDISSYIKAELNPTVLINSFLNNDQTKRENNIMKNINKKERQIFRLYRNGLGKDFLNKKPNSVITFEKNFGEYLFSKDSKFLNNFSFFRKRIQRIRKRINNLPFGKKIDIGTMVYYSLKEKKYKNVIYSTSFQKKYLEKSKNFLSAPPKEIINNEFYRVKYLEKNSKRINKILLNKLIEKNPKNLYKIDNKSSTRNAINLNNNIDYNINNTFNKKKNLTNDNLKNIFYEDNNNTIIDEKENSYLENNKISILSYNDKKSNKIFRNLTEGKIFEKSIKNKNNNNYYTIKVLKSLKNNIYKNNFIFTDKSSASPSPLSTSLKNRNNLNINIHRSNSNIKLLKNIKDKHNINIYKAKSKSRNVLNIDFIKKKSSKYKRNINSNINNLDNYTKSCNSLLANLVKKNQTEKEKYLKTSLNNEDKEIKKILKNNNSKFPKNNKFIEEKLNKIKILIKNSNYLDDDIRKMLKGKIKYDKKNINDESIFREYLPSDNIVFGNDDWKKPEIFELINNKNKLIENKRMNKLRKTIKNNNNIIIKLKNFIKLDRNKIMNIIENINNNNE